MNPLALWSQFSDWVMKAGLPTVAIYHSLCGSAFLNISASDAKGIEKAANLYLAPIQYLLAGHEASPVLSEEGNVISYTLKQRFSYEDPFLWVKTIGAYVALPSSLIIGGSLKGVSYFFDEVRSRQNLLSTCLATSPIVSNVETYKSMGIDLVEISEAEPLVHQGYPRRPGDELKLQAEKQALREIVSLFNEHKIVHWLDCGTCLGAYRHGGSIPWDWDVDLSILQPDFENARSALQKLDPEKYMVQDWSSRDNPRSYLKVYVKESDALIDIYHFTIDEQQKSVCWILSNEHSVFLPDSWKIRERRYIVPTSFDILFPLKKASFDGVETFVPNQTQKYLEDRYGDISPAKIYSEETGQYEKDLNHPYWKEKFNR